MASETWDLPTQYLKGVGEKLAALLAKADIRSLWDLLLQLPRSYEDRRHFNTPAEMFARADSGVPVFGKATILDYHAKFAGPRGRRWLEASAQLEAVSASGAQNVAPSGAQNVAPSGAQRVAPSGAQRLSAPQITLTWFNDYGGSTQKRFPPGTAVTFRGKVQSFRGALQIVHPELQLRDAEMPPWEFGGFVPVYREVSGISTRTLRKIVAQALERPELRRIPEALPAELCARLELAPFAESLRELHFPKRWEPDAVDPRPKGFFFRRIVFEELFMMALALHLRRAEWKLEGHAERVPCIPTDPTIFAARLDQLPYALTHDQRRAVDEILADLALRDDHVPMHRLVQGDVGSGKTIVAFLAALAAMDAGFQVAMMAPTEILADQHLRNFLSLFPERAHEVLLLKGALSAKTKRQARDSVREGQTRFVIGTQALLTDTTLFQKLALVIVDEQHRFGVEQRLGLKAQSEGLLPHLLVMTATPIPRSLALTLYGDLNISLIREKPPGRTPIRTHVVRKKAHAALVQRLKQFLAEGRQIYLVYPLVEESAELDLKDVQNAFKEWQVEFSGTPMGLLHGRMKSAAKETAMRSFKNGETRVLVSTTVIEVGVDVPNASVIVIAHAERFGLSQLHQLRGRVGRGAQQSYCVLIGPDHAGPEVAERLRILEESEDGFYVAERDLEIRGPGEFLGRKQSGLPGFRVAHILRDLALMESAREEARKLLEADPRLATPENRALREVLAHWWKGRLDLTLSG